MSYHLRLPGTPYWLVVIALASSFPVRAAGFELMEATISTINRAFDEETVTSEQLVDRYLERIQAYDRQGPAIRSLLSLNPDARKQARALDRERREQGPRSPLHGVPFIVKDNYDTAGIPTTAGSVLLEGSVPADDASSVQRLREAGAIIIGKANMSEFALSLDRLGHSSLGGLTRNPYNLERNASGSSSGSAAAVAANFSVFSTGTDTAGSIRAPASVTGTVGIKPTLGLTSRDGVVPVSLSFDVPGPIARKVEDAAIALQFMAGVDPNDPRTSHSRGWQVESYMQFLDEDGLKDSRLGVARDYAGGNPEVDEIVENALAKMREQGATLVALDIPRDVRNAWIDKMKLIIDREFAPQLASYLDTRPGNIPRTVSELIAGYKTLPETGPLPTISPERIKYYETVAESPGVADVSYLYTLTNKLPKTRNEIAATMQDKNLDAIVFPTMLCPASPLFTLETDTGYVCSVSDPYIPSYLASVTGFPEITVPAGMTRQGLPVGISFFGVAYSEPRLIALAYAFEMATKARRPPPTTPPVQ
jgi:amidase